MVAVLPPGLGFAAFGCVPGPAGGRAHRRPRPANAGRRHRRSGGLRQRTRGAGRRSSVRGRIPRPSTHAPCGRRGRGTASGAILALWVDRVGCAARAAAGACRMPATGWIGAGASVNGSACAAWEAPGYLRSASPSCSPSWRSPCSASPAVAANGARRRCGRMDLPRRRPGCRSAIRQRVGPGSFQPLRMALARCSSSPFAAHRPRPEHHGARRHCLT